MAFLSIPVNNCCRPLSRTLNLSDAIDEMLGMALRPVGYHHYPKYLCISPKYNNSTKPFCAREGNQNGDKVKVAELDVRKYKPEEVECKVEDGKVLVSGKHRSEIEHGYDTSEFHRAFNLPENVDQESVKSRIENGVLQIEASKQQIEEAPGEETKNEKFTLKINIGSYKPEDVNVKLHGNDLVVSAEHKADQEGVYTGRHFKQYFTLPNEVDVSTVTSKITKDGELSIEAERRTTPAIEDKEIEIQRDEEMAENAEE